MAPIPMQTIHPFSSTPPCLSGLLFKICSFVLFRKKIKLARPLTLLIFSLIFSGYQASKNIRSSRSRREVPPCISYASSTAQRNSSLCRSKTNQRM